MDLRLSLYELAARHQLDARATQDLVQLAGFGREPAALALWLPRLMALLAGALGGLGVIFWVAANWEDFGRFGRFALLQGLFFAVCLGALGRPAARVPLALLALLTIGALWAYFGQTYQTGADPWQLFALWALLALPLCCSVRSDVLWTPWVLLAFGALSLWLDAYSGDAWRVREDDFLAHALAWGGGLLLVGMFSPPARRCTGAGRWPLRTALALAVGMITASVVAGLFGAGVTLQYWLGLLILCALGAAFAQAACYDMVALCALGLGLNIALVALLLRVLDAVGGSGIGQWALLGVAAALLLAATMSGILALGRRYERAGAAA